MSRVVAVVFDWAGTMIDFGSRASAIFSAQQVGDEARADLLMLVALLVGFAAIWSAELLSRGDGGGSR